MNDENIYARCVCGSMWGTIAPVGTKELECPECRALCPPIGVIPKERRSVCGCCGGDTFHVAPEAIYCVVCGKSLGTDLRVVV